MKTIFLFLLTFTAHAQFVAHIDYVNPSHADGQLKAEDQTGIDKEIDRFIKKREKRGEKCVNNECFKIIKVKAVYELDENGNKVYDKNGEPIILEPAKVIEEKFLSISIEDISQQVATKEAEKVEKEKRKEELKAAAKEAKEQNKAMNKKDMAEAIEMLLERL